MKLLLLLLLLLLLSALLIIIKLFKLLLSWRGIYREPVRRLGERLRAKKFLDKTTCWQQFGNDCTLLLCIYMRVLRGFISDGIIAV